MSINWGRENPKLTKRGGTELLDNGTASEKIKSCATVRGEWNVTRLGQRYFRDRPPEYIIQIPIMYNILTTRDNADIQYRGYIPITSLNAKARGVMSDITARDGGGPGLLTRLMQGVLNEAMRYRDQDGNVAVHVESDVTAWCDPDTTRDWRCSEMRTTVEDGGYAEQAAFLHRRMRYPKPSSSINVAGVAPEAFEERKTRVNSAIYK